MVVLIVGVLAVLIVVVYIATVVKAIRGRVPSDDTTDAETDIEVINEDEEEVLIN